MRRGRAIAFEGGDGMGKATQSKLLADKLGAKLFSFPRYETEVGQAIRGSCRGILEMREYRDIVGRPHEVAFAENKQVNALARQALFLLDRCDAAPEIERFLANGTDVVFDRYWPSGVVYGADDGLDPQLLIRAHSSLPQPDVWILLDGTVEESFRRRPKRQDNYERDREGAERRRQAYLKLFRARRAEGDFRWCIIDGMRPVDEVHRHVCELAGV